MYDDPNLHHPARQYARQHHRSTLEALKEFVRIPSVSTDPAARPCLQAAAEWVAHRLNALGLQAVEILPGGGAPVVLAHATQAGPQRPTVLVYGHYDVQPAEPLALWLSPPFEPQVRGENLYGRGTSDMKGQVIASLAAVEALLASGGLPVNLVFLIEGEEEIGSPNLGAFLAAHTRRLECDFALNLDSDMIAADQPAITYGLRGLAYFEIRLTGPEQDLHSGLFGGVVHNPAQVLCELIAGMHDAQGRITLPGFYDRVLPIDPQERRELARLPMDEAYYMDQAGVPALYGEAGYTPAERVSVRPTLDIHGLSAGYSGPGGKTVLPSQASAKLSMRLAPDQDPAEVADQLRQYLHRHTPATVQWELINMGGGPAVVTERNSPAVQALEAAMYVVWGRPPLFRREGGSIPAVAEMQRILDIDSVMTGFSLPDDAIHAPNEKLHLPTFYRGIDTLIEFFERV